MVKDGQVRMLMDYLNKGKSLRLSAAKSEMSEKTARKYRNSGQYPSQIRVEHTWRTRQDPFEDVWEKRIKPLLEYNPGLEGKTILNYLQREYPDKYQDGQLRTLQRRIKEWRATEGPAKEVFFAQNHYPGDLGASDFTHMTSLGITIGGRSFPHLLYHFVLTYSNWETGMICFSESFESLSAGVQNALWELGGVPKRHRTDRLSAAVQKPDHPEEFTSRYQALLNHYDIKGEKIQPGKGNENGDVEQSHYRFKEAVDQALMLRGHRDFASEEDYIKFLREIFRGRNSGRQKRFQEELKVLKVLPQKRFLDYQELEARVNSFSMIRVACNSYSVDSRLIGEWVKVRLYAHFLEVWYGQRFIETLPRLKGKFHYRVCYRHIIDWLVRKPGAFENYRYKKDLFPSTYFRLAYDFLRSRKSNDVANKEYLKILYVAARESEMKVEEALKNLFKKEMAVSLEAVEGYVSFSEKNILYQEYRVDPVSVEQYDGLLSSEGRCC
jgi:hypothetical protein